MSPHIAQVFIDGGHLRKEGANRDVPFPDRRKLSERLVESGPIQTWAHVPTEIYNAVLSRVTYYDALPNDETPHKPDQQAYWDRIELLPDVHLGFGALKGLRRTPRQKGVDTLLLTDALVGAFSRLFSFGTIVTGDADLISVVEAMKLHGVMVAAAGDPASVSNDLRRGADRFIELNRAWFENMSP